MAPTERTNYFKLVALLVDIACHVICTYIREHILDSSSFESFLKKEKHKLLHLYETTECCECVSEKIRGEKIISRKQLLLLYKLDETKQIRNHKKYVGGKVAQICICKYVAVEKLDVKIIDITLANQIILKCGKQELGLDNWMAQIKEVRNSIFHTSDIQEITDDKFSRKWNKLQGSILGIAGLIGRTFVEDTEKKIFQTKKLTFIPDYMLKYEIMCRDYWKNKCAEFERAQIEEFEKKAKSLHIQYPNDFSESIGKDYQKTKEGIRNLRTIVDNINILINVFGQHEDMTSRDRESVKKDFQRVHVPVILQLDLPAPWNRRKILDYLNEMRLNRTSDTNIRIIAVSPDDLKIYSEIANTVLRKVDLLQDEVKRIMSGMLSNAEVDLQQNAEVVVNFTIQEMTDKIEKQSEDEEKQMDHISIIHDDETRTTIQFDGKNETKSKCEDKQVDDGQTRTSIQFDDKIEKESKDEVKQVDHLSIIQDDEKRKNIQFDDKEKIKDNGEGENKLGKNEMKSKYDEKQVDDGRTRKNVQFDVNEIDAAVSYIRSYIEVININTGKVKNTIETLGTAFGLSFLNELLYVVIDEKRIDVIKLTGEIIRSFNVRSQSVFNIATDGDRLFLCDYVNDTLYCYDLHGTFIWKFAADEKHMFLWGIATDGFGNVYVTCRNSNNVLVVSPDGQHHEKLVCRRNGLIFPTGIYFDSSINGLLTCNEIGGLVMCTKIYDAVALLHDDSLQLTTRLLDKIKVNGNVSKECYKASEYLHITDCTMIGKFIILLDSYNKRLIIHDKDGTDNRDIKLTGEPQNISPINDNDLAVSSSQSYIEIISINTAQIKNLIAASGDTYGISYHNGLLYVVIDRTKIDVMNLRGEITRSFTLPSSKVWDLTTYKNRLFFADVFEEILYCFDLNGVVIWKFNCDKMKSPNEVTTDQNGNVYVTCSVYNTIVVVSSDGKHYKELFNKKDGLRKPTGIYYDKSTNNLLVCNAGDDYALIFDIKQ